MNETIPPALVAFATTRWTLVLRAQGTSGEGRAALAELCQAYWQPVYRFLLRERRTPEAAAELTQEFFAGILARGALGAADPTRGRFRSYLLGALKHFLVNERLRARRLKRGGGASVASLDEESDDREMALQVEDSRSTPPDAFFDREWALAVMDGGLKALQREFVMAGKTREYEVLKPWLAGSGATGLYGKAGAELGLSEVAAKVAVHRLRKRFRELIRKELAETVADPGEVDEELRYLVEVLAQA